jgi:hypothetical protein
MSNTKTNTNANARTKKGGMIMDDVNKLVVPFGLLLAEKGLSNMMKKDKKTAKTTTAAAKKTTVKQNRKAAVGGANSSGSKKLTNEFSKLSSEIEHFLSKY